MIITTLKELVILQLLDNPEFTSERDLVTSLLVIFPQLTLSDFRDHFDHLYLQEFVDHNRLSIEQEPMVIDQHQYRLNSKGQNLLNRANNALYIEDDFS